jgi:hypothetical protein
MKDLRNNVRLEYDFSKLQLILNTDVIKEKLHVSVSKRSRGEISTSRLFCELTVLFDEDEDAAQDSVVEHLGISKVKRIK